MDYFIILIVEMQFEKKYFQYNIVYIKIRFYFVKKIYD